MCLILNINNNYFQSVNTPTMARTVPACVTAVEGGHVTLCQDVCALLDGEATRVVRMWMSVSMRRCAC